MPSLKCRVELTNKCKNNCWYCYAPKNEESMTRKLFTSIMLKMKDVYDQGNFPRFKLGFSGGDPFQDEFILEAHQIAKDIFKDNFDSSVSSFCQHSKVEIGKKYMRMGGRAFLSLNEDPLDNIEYMLNAFSEEGYRTGLFFILTEYNIERLDAIIDLILKYDTLFRVNHLYDINNEIGTEKLNKAIDQVFDRLGGIRMHHAHPIFSCINTRNKTSQYCGYGKDYYHFNVNGEVSRCQCESPITDVNDPDLESKIRTKIDYSECQECPVFFMCRGGCIYANQKKAYCDVYKHVCARIIEYRKPRKETIQCTSWSPK